MPEVADQSRPPRPLRLAPNPLDYASPFMATRLDQLCDQPHRAQDIDHDLNKWVGELSVVRTQIPTRQEKQERYD